MRAVKCANSPNISMPLAFHKSETLPALPQQKRITNMSITPYVSPKPSACEEQQALRYNTNPSCACDFLSPIELHDSRHCAAAQSPDSNASPTESNPSMAIQHGTFPQGAAGGAGRHRGPDHCVRGVQSAGAAHGGGDSRAARGLGGRPAGGAAAAPSHRLRRRRCCGGAAPQSGMPTRSKPLMSLLSLRTLCTWQTCRAHLQLFLRTCDSAAAERMPVLEGGSRETACHGAAAWPFVSGAGDTLHRSSNIPAKCLRLQEPILQDDRIRLQQFYNQCNYCIHGGPEGAAQAGYRGAPVPKTFPGDRSDTALQSPTQAPCSSKPRFFSDSARTGCRTTDGAPACLVAPRSAGEASSVTHLQSHRLRVWWRASVPLTASPSCRLPSRVSCPPALPANTCVPFTVSAPRV